MKEPAIKLPAELQSLPMGDREVLLHACCAPCSSAIVEWMITNGLRPTIFYYNPNIWPQEEYEIRKQESKRHAEKLGIRWIDGDYSHETWRSNVCGLEDEPERGRRCEQCFTLRLTAAAHKAKELGIKVFATTLASSRWKSLEQIERAGLQAEKAVSGTTFWAQNWRKGGLQDRRNQLLKEYQFYNQQYCGCEFSTRQSAPTKAILRHQMRLARQQHAAQLHQWSTEIIERLYMRLTDYQIIMAYWPLPDEVDIRPLLDRLVSEGRIVLLPCVIDKETMMICRYNSTADLTEGAFHIMEPTGASYPTEDPIDAAIIPGVAFDAAGHRLGRGRGYYDRFLAAHPHIYKIGVCFSFQHVSEVPTLEHDISMDVVVF